MKRFLSPLLLAGCLCSTAAIGPKVVAQRFPESSRSRRTSQKNDTSWVQKLPRGGAAKRPKNAPPPSSPVDWRGLLDFAKSVGQTIWKQDIVQEAVHMSPADVAQKVSSFVGKQRNKANKRRQAFRDDPSIRKTSSAVLSAPRALKLTLAAFVVAEILQFLETNTMPMTASLHEKAETLSHDLSIQLENFLYVGRSEGGLLRPETWMDRAKVATAVQEQIEPKYQWALGTAVGFVLSPLCWTLGWTALGWSAALYMLAETHHFCKAGWDKYYYTLKEWDSPIVFAIDDFLEDTRRFFFTVATQPKETILAMRDDIDDRMDFVFPPHVQKGLMFGSIVGVITGA